MEVVPTIFLLSVSFLLTVLFSFGSNAQDCIGLPDTDFFKQRLQTQLINDGGEGGNNLVVTVQDGPFYTCQVQGTTMGAYQELSVILTYTTNTNNSPRSRQFEIDCISAGAITDWERRSDSLSSVLDASVDYSSLGTFTNCSRCTSSAGNDNHCQACDSACNVGLMRCTGTTDTDCCVAFEDDGMCKEDLDCTKNNFVANEQNNFICTLCNISCDPGYAMNSTDCMCVLDNICETVPSPCNNGGNCTLTAAPSNYTCDCNGTGYTGDNCSVLVPSPSITTTDVQFTVSSASAISSRQSGTSRPVHTTATVTADTNSNERPSSTEISTSVGPRSRSTTSTPARPRDSARARSGDIIPAITVSVIIGILLIIAFIVLLLYIIYYFVELKGRPQRQKYSLWSHSHSNPLYINPDEVIEGTR